MHTPKHTTTAGLAISALFCLNQAQAVLWTPSEISTALWFDASDSGSITTGPGGVSQWNDQSGNGRNATQATDTAQADLGTHNGLGTVNLNGSSDFFELGTGLDWLAGGGGNATHTTFAVLNVSVFSNLYGAATAAGPNEARLHVGFRSAADYRINRWGNDYYPPTTNFVADEFNLVRWSWVEDGPKSVFANSLEEETGTSGGGLGTSLAEMSDGGRIGNIVGQGFLGAEIGEIIMIDGSPDQATTDQIEGYLAWKWGEQGKLPMDHSYKNAAPLIPEPSTSIMLSLVSLGLLGHRRRCA